MKSLVDVIDAMEAWIHGLDINTPPDVVGVSGVVNGFEVNYYPHGGACDAVARTTVVFYVSRADDASALRQCADLQSTLKDSLEGPGPWLSVRLLEARTGDAVHAETRYATVTCPVEVYV